MTSPLACYRCGNSLAKLTLPLSRLDECPSCSVYLHACRMCLSYDSSVVRQCREDDAEEVLEKERANFCEWFKPNPAAYDPEKGTEARRAEEALNALFSDSTEDTPGSGTDEAEDLFK